MRNRVVRWVAALLVALTFGAGLLAGGAHTPVAYGDSPTPTASGTNPSGGGGGH